MMDMTVPVTGVFCWRDLVAQGNDWLRQCCPKEFRESGNPWRQFSAHYFSHPGPTKDWPWRGEVVNTKETTEALRSLLWGNFDLTSEDKYAVTGWFLSLVLNEPPPLVWRWKQV